LKEVKWRENNVPLNRGFELFNPQKYSLILQVSKGLLSIYNNDKTAL